MPAIVEIVIEPVECPPPVLVQQTVAVCVLGRYARMPESFLLRVLNKKHIVDNVHQAASESHGFFILTRECLRHLSLGSIPVPEAAVPNIFFLHFGGIFPEHPVNQEIINIRLRISSGRHVETQTGELLRRIRHGRIEMSQKPVHGIRRNLPDAEEPQYMVNPESIEIL